MSRFNTLLLGVLSVSQLVFSAPSNLHTLVSPFSFSPSVEILQSPVTKVETIRLEPQVTKAVSTSASAVAIARAPQYARTVPLIQRVESYSSGDSSNTEIRNLLRSLLSELRNGNTRSSALTAPQPFISDSYGPPSRQKSGALTAPSDSYGAPPRNTISDPNAPSYPDSFDNSRRNNIDDFDKPEKVQQSSRLIQEAPVQYKEIVRTVYQPVYVPYQYAQPELYTVAAQPVQQLTAVPTRINTGSSAVAISTIHSSPAYAIQQQQYSLPLVQQQSVQPLAAYASAGQVFEESSGYVKK